MINLLPQKEKDVLYLKRVKNLSLVLGSIVVISIICMVFVLMSVKFYMLTEADNQKFLLTEAQKSYKSPTIEYLKNVIEKYNKLLPVVINFYQKRIYTSDVLAVISSVEKADGLYFTSMSLDSQTSENSVRVIISGTSDTRENLLAFQKKLSEQGKIKNVSFSPDSWISPTKTNFKVSFDFVKNGN